MDTAILSKKLNIGIQLFGDEWILLIIGTLGKKEMRYCQLLRAMPSINPATLSNRLKKLELVKIVKRREETVDKLSVTYSLTEKGLSALPVLLKLRQYADKYL